MKVKVGIQGICVNLMATRFMTRNIKWFIVSRLNIYLFQVRNAKCRIDNVNLIKRKK